MDKTQSPDGFHSQVDSALETMRDLFAETPLQLNDHLSNRYGARVWLKREDLSPVRSYKIRGAFNFIRQQFLDKLDDLAMPSYVGRRSSGAAAEGVGAWHRAAQEQLVAKALSLGGNE